MTSATAFPDQYVLRVRPRRPGVARLFASSRRNGAGRALGAEALGSARKFATPADAILYALGGAILPAHHGKIEVVRIDFHGARELAVLGTVRDLAATPEGEGRKGA